MKKIILLTVMCSALMSSYAQKKVKYYRWLPTKQSYCSVNQVQAGTGLRKSIINIFANYTWGKQQCTEQQSLNQQQLKISKGIHFVKGSSYYFDGSQFYKVNKNVCSANGISINEFLNLLGG